MEALLWAPDHAHEGLPPRGPKYTRLYRPCCSPIDRTCLLEFVDILNDMRFGKLNGEDVAKLKGLERPIVYQDGIQPTELCVSTTRNNA